MVLYGLTSIRKTTHKGVVQCLSVMIVYCECYPVSTDATSAAVFKAPLGSFGIP